MIFPINNLFSKVYCGDGLIKIIFYLMKKIFKTKMWRKEMV